MAGKYKSFERYLQNIPDIVWEITLSFSEIEGILNDKLPQSARRHLAWWANERDGMHVQAHAWMDAGWKADTVNLTDQWTRFIRI